MTGLAVDHWAEGLGLVDRTTVDLRPRHRSTSPTYCHPPGPIPTTRSKPLPHPGGSGGPTLDVQVLPPSVEPYVRRERSEGLFDAASRTRGSVGSTATTTSSWGPAAIDTSTCDKTGGR